MALWMVASGLAVIVLAPLAVAARSFAGSLAVTAVFMAVLFGPPLLGMV